MAVYKAPLKDINFVLNEVLDVSSLSKLPGYQDATPDVIQWAPGLPKTRSGKIMRRILKKIAANDIGDLGDTSTLADPSVVDNLVANRQTK